MLTRIGKVRMEAQDCGIGAPKVLKPDIKAQIYECVESSPWNLQSKPIPTSVLYQLHGCARQIYTLPI